LPASRRANDHHQFVTLEFSRKHLQKQRVQNESDLDPGIRRVIFGGKDESVVAPARPMSIQQRSVVAGLAEPPVAKAAQILWYQSKALELMAHFLFAPKDPEFFCMRQKRVARERVERAKELLARDLANPPTLEALGQEVGCSPFYLSRIFSREVGLTIPQYLRNLRMERAAELLRTGRYNVTEAATEVGYSSLSHFSKAFCETIGCCPVLYPAAKNVILGRCRRVEKRASRFVNGSLYGSNDSRTSFSVPVKITRALVSVSDKTGIASFARALERQGVDIISTGGTADLLRKEKIPVREISSFTAFPEVLEGRVKTLHPRVHGGLLYKRGNAKHEAEARECGFEPIDLVVVNLYPFEATIANPGVTLPDAIENIDIGGPSMIRSAAKNYESVTVVVD